MKFQIVNPGEPFAGIIGFEDEIEIIVESGDPGGEPGEFEAFMRDCLADWYDGASVWVEQNES